MEDLDQYALRYVLCLAKIRIDEEIEEVPLYAYGQTPDGKSRPLYNKQV
jgi:hypothetical protein